MILEKKFFLKDIRPFSTVLQLSPFHVWILPLFQQFQFLFYNDVVYRDVWFGPMVLEKKSLRGDERTVRRTDNVQKVISSLEFSVQVT